MKLLLANKANPSAVAGNGTVPLISAAASRNVEAVKLLLEHGADVNAMTKRQQTAIFGAASRGAEDVVNLLLEEGAEVPRRLASRATCSARINSLLWTF